MLSRCQLSTNLSKTASTSFFIATSNRRILYRNNSTSSSSQDSSGSQRKEPAGTSTPQRHSHYLQDVDVTSTPIQNRSQKNPIIPSAESASKSRQTMTERESKVLTDMLDMIFAANNQPNPPPPPVMDDTLLPEPPVPQGGVGPVQVDDLFRRLRRLNTGKPTYKARAATAEMFDLKKEEMNNCKSDQELLEWAAREVFDESVRYEKAAKQVADESANSGSKQKNAPPLQSPIYPQMIAHLMRTFRDHYHDPNLALYIFEYAQKLSIVSYTFGCSTEAYNELIETRWSSFKDLQGVLDALNEMTVNAVPVNSQTYTLVDRIRLDFGRDSPLKQSENSKLLTTIEDTLNQMSGGKADHRVGLGAWKNNVEEDDGDGFDDWTSSALMRFNPAKKRGQQRIK